MMDQLLYLHIARRLDDIAVDLLDDALAAKFLESLQGEPQHLVVRRKANAWSSTFDHVQQSPFRSRSHRTGP